MFIRLFPILAFIAGAMLKTLSIIFNTDISATMAGLFSIVSLAVLMLTFSLIYSK